MPCFVMSTLGGAVPARYRLIGNTCIVVKSGKIQAAGGTGRVTRCRCNTGLSSHYVLHTVGTVRPNYGRARVKGLLGTSKRCGSIIAVTTTKRHFRLTGVCPARGRVRLNRPVSLAAKFGNNLSDQAKFIIRRTRRLPSARESCLRTMTGPCFTTMID